eukprot:4655710-Pyramimonas_sp.AAC.1
MPSSTPESGFSRPTPSHSSGNGMIPWPAPTPYCRSHHARSRPEKRGDRRRQRRPQLDATDHRSPLRRRSPEEISLPTATGGCHGQGPIPCGTSMQHAHPRRR